MDNSLRELIINTAIGHAIRTDQLYNGLKALNKRGCIWADGEIIRGLGLLGSYGVRDRQAIDSLLHVSQTLSYEAKTILSSIISKGVQGVLCRTESGASSCLCFVCDDSW